MECRNSKSDWIDRDNKLCYHPKDKEVFLSCRSDAVKLKTSITQFKINTTQRIDSQKSEQLIWDAAHVIPPVVWTVQTWFVENEHVSSKDTAKTALLTSLRDWSWSSSTDSEWEAEWIYGHNNSTQVDCEYKPISRFAFTVPDSTAVHKCTAFAKAWMYCI